MDCELYKKEKEMIGNSSDFYSRMESCALQGIVSECRTVVVPPWLWRILTDEPNFVPKLDIHVNQGTRKLSYMLEVVTNSLPEWMAHDDYMFTVHTASEYKALVHTREVSGRLYDEHIECMRHGYHDPGPVINPPVTEWERQPELFLYDVAKQLDPTLKHFAGRLLMRRDYRIVAIIKDGFGQIIEFDIYENNSPTLFAAKALTYFWPEEVAVFLNTNALMELREMAPQDWWGDWLDYSRMGILADGNSSGGDRPNSYTLYAECCGTRGTRERIEIFATPNKETFRRKYNKHFPVCWKSYPI